jgi:argininosuccinate lyase
LDEQLSADAVTAAMVERALAEVVGLPLRVTEAEIRDSLDPGLSVAEHKSTGGPAPPEVRRIAADLAEHANEAAAWISARKSALRRASEDLMGRVRILAAA